MAETPCQHEIGRTFPVWAACDSPADSDLKSKGDFRFRCQGTNLRYRTARFRSFTGLTEGKTAAAKILRAKENTIEARYFRLMLRHPRLRAAFLALRSG